MRVRKITLQEARARAEPSAHNNLDWYRTDKSIPLLRNEYLENDLVWVFFRNKEIEVDPKNGLKWNYAYFVSKKTLGCWQAHDFSDDPIKMQEYLEFFSDMLRRTGK